MSNNNAKSIMIKRNSFFNNEKQAMQNDNQPLNQSPSPIQNRGNKNRRRRRGKGNKGRGQDPK